MYPLRVPGFTPSFLVGSMLLIFLVFWDVLFLFYLFSFYVLRSMLPVSLDRPFLIPLWFVLSFIFERTLTWRHHIYFSFSNAISIYAFMQYSNMTSFFCFVDKRAIYQWYNLIRTCTGECDWLFHWQHNLCVNVNINYRLPIKVCYRICTLRHIRIEINHGSRFEF